MDFLPQKHTKTRVLPERWDEKSTKVDDSC